MTKMNPLSKIIKHDKDADSDESSDDKEKRSMNPFTKLIKKEKDEDDSGDDDDEKEKNLFQTMNPFTKLKKHEDDDDDSNDDDKKEGKSLMKNPLSKLSIKKDAKDEDDSGDDEDEKDKNLFQTMNPFTKLKKHEDDDSDSNDGDKKEEKRLMKNPISKLNIKKDDESTPLIGRMLPHRKPRHSVLATMEHKEGNKAWRSWDVKMPPAKKTMVGGKLVPNPGEALTGFMRQKPSRVVIEVVQLEGSDSDSDNEEKVLQEGLLRGKSTTHVKDEAIDEDVVMTMRILRPSDEVEEDEKEKGASIALDPKDKALKPVTFPGWCDVYHFDPDDVELLSYSGMHAVLKLGRGAETMVRQLNFASKEECDSFCQVVESLGKLEDDRMQRKIEYFLEQNDGTYKAGEAINILVEIVSGVRLPIADITSTDAYCVVYLGRKEIHRTKYISSTINPIWTIDNGSLFLIQTTPEDFFGSSSGLTISVRDYDAMGKNDVLGKVIVDQDDLIEGTGERIEHKLMLDQEFKDAKDARLVLRYRRATPDDMDFMERYAELKMKKKGIVMGAVGAVAAVAEDKPIVGAYADEAYVAPRAFRVKLLQRETKKDKEGNRLFRVKPEPDPSRPEETKWLTNAEIDKEAQKPSTNWMEVGSGGLGKLFFEVISCDGLPNLDDGVTSGKTDAFVSLIFEDAIVNTDVINDTLKPRWPPWTQRAFIFNVLHPSSQVLLGVFDFDDTSSLDGHDPVGRVSIDVTNLRPSTEYVMEYDLYTSALVSKRESFGSVKVRMRVEWEDQRKALMAAFKLPPDIYVNVPTHRDFQCARYTSFGECNVEEYDTEVLTSYIEEIRQYEALQYMVRDALFTVLLWRGHLPVTFWVPTLPLLPADPENPKSFLRRLFKPKKLKLALHSLVAFLLGIMLAEDYNFFPSYILFMISWLLLASMEYQYRNPSPWEKKRRLGEMWQVLLFNRKFTESIEPNERKEEVEKFLAERDALMKRREEEAQKKRERAEKEAAALAEEQAAEQKAEEEMENKTKLAIGAAVKPFSAAVQPLKPFLYPVQLNLGKAVVVVRVIRSIITWEECYYAFWATNACLILGILAMAVPWDFLIHWAFRIAVWVFLGPWMKLVDIYFVKGRSREELKKEEEEKVRMKYQKLVQARRGRQIEREDALKLKFIKRYMYGQYLLSVPKFKESRWVDRPLYPSHASPHVGGSKKEHVSAYFSGQHLTGHMIPVREVGGNPDGKEKDGAKSKYGATD